MSSLLLGVGTFYKVKSIGRVFDVSILLEGIGNSHIIPVRKSYIHMMLSVFLERVVFDPPTYFPLLFSTHPGRC